MKAAPNPGFLGGLWIDVKTWVNDLVFKDAMADKEQAKTWQDRVDAERRRNPVNIVINRLVKPAVQGVYDSATATINSLLHPITALQGVTNGVYVILTDPAGVGEAVYMKYEDFSKLSAIQQNDLVVSFAGGMIFDAVTGKYAPVAMSKALTGANTGATVVGKAFSETAKELQRGGSVYASSGIAGQGDVFYQKLVAQIREIQKGKLAEEIAAATESGRGVHAPNNVSSGLTIEPVERIGVGKVGRDFVRNAEDGLPRFEARLLDGDKTLSIGWTDNIPRTAVRLREVQQLAGGPGSFTRITGLASAEFEASVRAGTFDLGNAGEMLGKALGGKWNVRLVPRAGQQGVFDVVAELIGG
ncbi:hypothetical protein SAMN05444166_0886 [Singulisphaera sp. GP187]|uniref:hypothetical protein n=1 Tax=Singulisphaera sp. GP187 TaxID=1882752 RepID=UPI000927EAD1|nr:hypothetical protein [Singulisphaera sp. GP187]SIN79245.1 hypothetical protein SAMN05444166_0886 [Singulisphaera sp. GP187]